MMPYQAIDRLPLIHPGEILSDELVARGVGMAKFAVQIGVSLETLRAILKGQAPVTTEVATALGRAFNTSTEFWLNLQRNYDLKHRLR